MWCRCGRCASPTKAPLNTHTASLYLGRDEIHDAAVFLPSIHIHIRAHILPTYYSAICMACIPPPSRDACSSVLVGQARTTDKLLQGRICFRPSGTVPSIRNLWFCFLMRLMRCKASGLCMHAEGRGGRADGKVIRLVVGCLVEQDVS